MGILENHTSKALNIPFKKVVLPGRVKCGGTEWEIVVAHGCRKRKKLICGPEEEIAVAHARLPSPARMYRTKLTGLNLFTNSILALKSQIVKSQNTKLMLKQESTET